MTSDKKRKEVEAYIDEIKKCCGYVMSLSNCDKYLNEEIVAGTMEQMIAKDIVDKLTANKHFERASPPVVENIKNETTPNNVVPFRKNS